MTQLAPPSWAEWLLRLSVKPTEYDNVSGDLLEEYRDSVLPARGHRRADLWYVTQVLVFMFSDAKLFGVLFGAAFIARTALDWFVPTVDFHTRSIVSTYLGIGVVLLAGFAAACRSGSIAAGAASGLTTIAIGAAISVCGAAMMLAIWHDAGTMAAIRQSGGVAEVFTLPFMLLVPGAALGTIGGAAAVAIRSLRGA
jgi:hypothetical protein